MKHQKLKLAWYYVFFYFLINLNMAVKWPSQIKDELWIVFNSLSMIKISLHLKLKGNTLQLMGGEGEDEIHIKLRQSELLNAY